MRIEINGNAVTLHPDDNKDYLAVEMIQTGMYRLKGRIDALEWQLQYAKAEYQKLSDSIGNKPLPIIDNLNKVTGQEG